MLRKKIAVPSSRRLVSHHPVLTRALRNIFAVLQTELDAVAAAARALPNLTLVVNHLGFCCVPDAGAPPPFAPWAAALRRLAASGPNVYVKISGGQV